MLCVDRNIPAIYTDILTYLEIRKNGSRVLLLRTGDKALQASLGTATYSARSREWTVPRSHQVHFTDTNRVGTCFGCRTAAQVFAQYTVVFFCETDGRCITSRAAGGTGPL